VSKRSTALLAVPAGLILLGALMRAPVLLSYHGPLTAHALNLDLMAHTGAYSAIGLRDYGRVDVRLHAERGPFVVDVNPNPDLSTDAGLARAAAQAGISYSQLVQEVARMALARAGIATAA